MASSPYNLNAANNVGDPNFVAAFNNAAAAINDLDSRVTSANTAIGNSLQPGEIAVAPNTELSLTGAGTVANPLTIGSASIIGAGRPDVAASMTTAVQAQVAAARVGATFTSTDGASMGAWAWQLRPTGWKVTNGETVWFDLTSLLANGWQATSVKIMRLTQSCVMELANPVGTSATASELLSKPLAGFGLSTSISTGGYETLGLLVSNTAQTATVGLPFWSDGNNVNIRISPATSVNVPSGVRTITWPSNGMWPIASPAS